MVGRQLTALILTAFSTAALRAQDMTATTNQPSDRPVHISAGPRPPIVGLKITESEIRFPPVIHICIARCAPLMWDRGHYINFGPENTSLYTVESFTRESVILHRTDKGRFPLTATLTGQISADGNSIVNGRIVWTSGNSGSGPFRAVWGRAILYPEQTDQDIGQRQKLNIPCDASSQVSIAEASERAEQLLEADDMPKATCWLRISATQGDAQAQGMLASVLYHGIGGVPVDFPGAAFWADKSSEHNYFLGEHVLALMYASGNGKPKDSAKAAFWKAKYEKDKLALDRAQQQAQDAQRQRAQAQAQRNVAAGLFMMQLFLGAYSGDSDSGHSEAWKNARDWCNGGDRNACTSLSSSSFK